MSFFTDLECLVWDTNPMYWQAVEAVRIARSKGVITSQDSCKANGDQLSNITGIDLSLVSGTFIECVCKRVFDGSPAPAIWRDWQALGGQVDGGIGAVATANGFIDVYVRGTDEKLWQKTWDGHKWIPDGTAWKPLDNSMSLGSSPTVVSLGPQHRDVYARGTDGQVWHKTWNGAWANWAPLGGQCIGSVGAVAVANGYIDLYVRGSDNKLWQKTWDGKEWIPGGNGWKPLDSSMSLGSAPTVVSLGPQHRDVYALGTDGQVWHKVWNGQWQNWVPLGGQCVGGVGAVATANGFIDLYVQGSDGRVWQKTWDGHQWIPGAMNWKPLDNTQVGSSPTVVSLGPQHRDVYVRGTDGGVEHKPWA